MIFFKRNKNTDPQESIVPQPQQEWPQQESQKMQRPRPIMTEQQVQRTREAKRLAETKRNNTEESLRRTEEQRDWLRRYTVLSLSLQEERDKLFALQKSLNSMSAEQESLARYESFESIHSDFERLFVLKTLSDEHKKSQLAMSQSTHELNQQWEEQLKLLKQHRESYQNASEMLHQGQTQIASGHFLNGQMDTLRQMQKQLKGAKEQCMMRRDAIRQQILTQEEETRVLEEELNTQHTLQKRLEPHQHMVLHSKEIGIYLEVLSTLQTNLNDYVARQEDRTRRQNDLNEQLSKTFGQYQQVVAQLRTLNDELTEHRKKIKGYNSYQLQERTMQLKSRRQMFLSALSLWRRISMGYQLWEEKKVQLNSLKLKIEQNEKNVQSLKNELTSLKRSCHEKEYIYLLNRGRDIIQLRADLKEGTNCPLCGASHHPYHSDTMLEQSILINEFKTDYEMLRAEVANKEALYMDMRTEMSELQGQRRAEEATLVMIIQRQEEDVKEWSVYNTLDASMRDCTMSTNRDARMNMIKHLLENTTKDMEEAQERLDFFNYHQNNVNELSDKIAQLELQKNELSTRLNEINTTCQVMAGQVDYLQENIDTTHRQFHQVSEILNAFISLPEWFAEWKSNHESVRQRILHLKEEWHSNVLCLEQIQKKAEEKKNATEALRELMDSIEQDNQLILTIEEQCQSHWEEYQKQYQKIMGERPAEEYYMLLHTEMKECAERFFDEQEKARQIQHEIDVKKGYAQSMMEQGEIVQESLAEQQQVIDLWIHKYNAQHPPIQATELETLLHGQHEWNKTREKLRALQENIIREQTKIEQIQAELMILETHGRSLRAEENKEQLQEELIAQHTKLEQKLREIIHQIARYEIALEEYEKSTMYDE